MTRSVVTLTVLALLTVAAPAAAQDLDFKRCGPKGFQCARIQVPLSYSDPASPTIALKVTRRRALQPKRRVGALFVNYGGPGGDAVATTQDFGRELFAPLRKRFDLVAVDPRGTGESAPVNCKVNQETQGIYRTPFVTPATVDTAAEEAKARFLADRCVTRNAKVAGHLSTANVARDFDRVRDALGYKRINYVGFSYGTMLGATYLKLFPQRVRAFVLDGAVDPVDYLLDPSADVRTQTAGFERALQRYFAACARARGACRWTRGGSPARAYDRLVARAAAKPIRAPRKGLTKGHTVPVDGDGINSAVIFDLYAKQYWPEITQALNQASRGDASLMRFLVDLANGRRKDGSFKPDNDRFYMISAGEQQWPRDIASVFARAPQDFEAFPHFAFNTGYSDVNWAVYPAADPEAYLGPFDLAPGIPTPVVVGTTFDPATPYANAKRMVASLGNARLLTMRGDGHTAYGGNSPCIDRLVKRYLVRLKLPRQGATCKQRVPFPAKDDIAISAGVSSRPVPEAWRPGGRR